MFGLWRSTPSSSWALASQLHTFWKFFRSNSMFVERIIKSYFNRLDMSKIVDNYIGFIFFPFIVFDLFFYTSRWLAIVVVINTNNQIGLGNKMFRCVENLMAMIVLKIAYQIPITVKTERRLQIRWCSLSHSFHCCLSFVYWFIRLDLTQRDLCSSILWLGKEKGKEFLFLNSNTIRMWYMALSVAF